MALCGFGAPPGRTSWPSPWCDTGPIRGSPISAVLGVPQTVSNPKWSFRRSARADASLLQ